MDVIPEDTAVVLWPWGQKFHYRNGRTGSHIVLGSFIVSEGNYTACKAYLQILAGVEFCVVFRLYKLINANLTTT